MRSRKEIYLDSVEHYEELSEQQPDKRAQKCFRRPDGVVAMIQAQAAQIEHKTVEEYLSEKYGIGSVADGQEHT